MYFKSLLSFPSTNALGLTFLARDVHLGGVASQFLECYPILPNYRQRLLLGTVHPQTKAVTIY
jgi:hypothetical protein